MRCRRRTSRRSQDRRLRPLGMHWTASRWRSNSCAFATLKGALRPRCRSCRATSTLPNKFRPWSPHPYALSGSSTGRSGLRWRQQSGRCGRRLPTSASSNASKTRRWRRGSVTSVAAWTPCARTSCGAQALWVSSSRTFQLQLLLPSGASGRRWRTCAVCSRRGARSSATKPPRPSQPRSSSHRRLHGRQEVRRAAWRGPSPQHRTFRTFGRYCPC
mmetsp:Transcript_64343/g.178404  ORF Transcript_64343/g.178404 Transcript_64343/m.178404 type:complete len:216 (+) Transcript_64343:165-812(+)